MIWVVSGAGVAGGMGSLRNPIVAIAASRPSRTYAADMNGLLRLTLKTARRVCVAVIGGTVVLVGVVMLVTPGPALLVIPAGLAILALEFRFASLWLRKLKQGGKLAMDRLRGDSSNNV